MAPTAVTQLHAAALAAIEEFETHDLPGRAREIEAIVREYFEPLQELEAVLMFVVARDDGD